MQLNVKMKRKTLSWFLLPEHRASQSGSTIIDLLALGGHTLKSLPVCAHSVVSDSLRPQARILDWVAISYSRGSSQPRDQTCISCISCIGGWILYHLGSLKVSLLLTITNVTTRRVLSTHPWHQCTWCLNSQTWDCPIKGFANFRFWMTLTNTLKGTFQNCAH